MEANYAIVVGANSIVGSYLLARLGRDGWCGECISRHHRPQPAGADERFVWLQRDVEAPEQWRITPGAVVISLLPLWLLPPLLPRLTPARQLIVISTTSIFAKATSSDPHEVDLVERMTRAEREICDASQAAGLAWTILRPTMIYDGERDKNISSIAGFIERFGFFPVAWPGRGLRQPVHADDVAQAILAAIDNPAARNTALNLPGAETLTYRDMVGRVFESLSRRPVIVPLPNFVLGIGLALARRLVRLPYSPALFERMNQDLSFDASGAKAALGYAPRPFRPQFRRPGERR